MTAKQYKINGVQHIVVNPLNPFPNSSIVKSVIKNNREIVVNMVTGDMFIYTPNLQKISIECGTANLTLSLEIEVAEIQIDDFLINMQDPKQETRFLISDNKGLVFVTSLRRNRVEFLRQIRYAYKNIVG